MSLRGIINTTLTNSSAALSVAFNDTHNSTTDTTTDPYYGGSLAGNIIVGIFIFIFVACILQSYCRGGCDSNDSNDTNGARVHRAQCRRAGRGQGPYAL